MLLDDIKERLGIGLMPARTARARGVQPNYEEQQPRNFMRSELLDHVAAIHEATHTVFAFINSKPILDVRIEGEGIGGGEFRHSERSTVELSDGSDTRVRAREDLMIMGALVEEDTCQDWLRDLVGFAVSKAAQHRFGARGEFYDAACAHDDAIIERVTDIIARSPEKARCYRRQINQLAEEFVEDYWTEIRRLGDRLFERKHLNKDDIEVAIAGPAAAR